MGSILILAFHVGILALLFFLGSFLFAPLLKNNMMINLSIYSALISLLSLITLPFLTLMHKFYRDHKLEERYYRDYINDFGNLLSVLILLFTAFLAYKFGIYHESLYTELTAYLGIESWTGRLSAFF